MCLPLVGTMTSTRIPSTHGYNHKSLGNFSPHVQLKRVSYLIHSLTYELNIGAHLPLTGIHWCNHFYIEKCLPFGLRSVPYPFNLVTEALDEWISRNYFVVQYCFHYVDDFFLAGPPLSNIYLHSAKQSKPQSNWRKS